MKEKRRLLYEGIRKRGCGGDCEDSPKEVVFKMISE